MGYIIILVRDNLIKIKYIKRNGDDGMSTEFNNNMKIIKEIITNIKEIIEENKLLLVEINNNKGEIFNV